MHAHGCSHVKTQTETFTKVLTVAPQKCPGLEKTGKDLEFAFEKMARVWQMPFDAEEILPVLGGCQGNKR